ncbi:MAG: hypothetical protein QF752_02720 [Planctomycetota bacterium]|nr:hypothetical protein [Planctomycetota bacterium]
MDNPLYREQAQAALERSLISPPQIAEAEALYIRWQSEGRQCDLAEAICEMTGSGPEVLQELRDRAKDRLLTARASTPDSSPRLDPKLSSTEPPPHPIRTALLAIVCLLCISFALFSIGWRNRTQPLRVPQQTHTPPPTTSQPIEIPSPTPDSPTSLPVPTEKTAESKRVFTYQYESRTKQSDSEGGSTSMLFTANIRQETLAQTGKFRLLAVTISPKKFSISPPNPNQEAGPDSLLQSIRSEEIAVRITHEGELLAFGFPRKWTSMERSLVLLPLFDLQLVRNPTDKATWSHREYDLVGAHKALYRQTSESIPGIIKTKSNHTSGSYQPRLLRSHTTFTLDPARSHISTVQGEEEHVLVVDESLSIQTHRQFRARFLSESDAQPAPPSLTQKRFANHTQVVLAHDRLLEPSPLPESEVQLPQNIDELDDLIGQIEQSETIDPSQREALLNALEFEELSFHLGESLRSGKHQNRLAVLLGALSENGNSACQHILRDLASDPELGENLRSRVVAEMGLIEHPDPETTVFLQSLLRSSNSDISRHAYLALGSAADQLLGRAPERSRRIVDSMASALEDRSTSESRRHMILLALGNVRSEESFQHLARWCREGSQNSRIQATQSLGNLEELPGVRSLLKSLANDSTGSPELIHTAVQAIGRQHARDRIPVLKELLQSGRRIETQLAALQELSLITRSEPTLHTWLTRCLRQLDNPKLQERAHELGLQR